MSREIVHIYGRVLASCLLVCLPLFTRLQGSGCLNISALCKIVNASLHKVSRALSDWGPVGEGKTGSLPIEINLGFRHSSA